VPTVRTSPRTARHTRSCKERGFHVGLSACSISATAAVSSYKTADRPKPTHRRSCIIPQRYRALLRPDFAFRGPRWCSGIHFRFAPILALQEHRDVRAGKRLFRKPYPGERESHHPTSDRQSFFGRLPCRLTRVRGCPWRAPYKPRHFLRLHRELPQSQAFLKRRFSPVGALPLTTVPYGFSPYRYR